MRAAALGISVALLAGAASGQPATEPPQGEPDAAAEPAPFPSAPQAPAPTIDPRAPTDAYDARVRESFAAAESFQGPLDGGWTLAAAGDGPLYAIRLVDHEGRLEAVWRDLRRPGALGASGVVDFVQRAGGRLTLAFSPAAGSHVLATLSVRAGGAWTGDLEENGKHRPVTLTKTSP